jgi:hypothetical protein
MWNLPGCLPEMEPMQFDTVEDARNALLDEINRMMHTPDFGTEAQWHYMWHSIAHTPSHDVPNNNWRGPDGYVYSIVREVE